MRSIVKTLIISIFFLPHLAAGQDENMKQFKIAETCLKYIVKGEADSCKALVDIENTRDLTKDRFETTFAQLNRDLSEFDSFKFYKTESTINFSKEFTVHTFNAISNKTRHPSDIAVEISFLENTNLIASIEPKLRWRFYAKPKFFFELESSFTARIALKKYNIRGIKINENYKNHGLLTIEVLYEIPYNVKFINNWGTNEGIKFAKYLVKNDYLKKAQTMLKEHGFILLDNICVLFIDPKTGDTKSVRIKKGDYIKQ